MGSSGHSYVGGVRRAGTAGAAVGVIDPATGDVLVAADLAGPADLEAAVHGAVAGALSNTGQDCTAATRALFAGRLTPGQARHAGCDRHGAQALAPHRVHRPLAPMTPMTRMIPMEGHHP